MLESILHLHLCKFFTKLSSKFVKSPKRERIQSFQLCNIWGKKLFNAGEKSPESRWQKSCDGYTVGGKFGDGKPGYGKADYGKAVYGKPDINSADIGICRHRWHEQNIIYN